MQICDDTCIWHPLLASSPSTRSTRGEVDCQDGTYPPLQTIGMELLEVGRARFFVLHICCSEIATPTAPLEPRPVTPRVRCCRTNLATTRNKGVALECLAVQRLRNSEFRGC